MIISPRARDVSPCVRDAGSAHTHTPTTCSGAPARGLPRSGAWRTRQDTGYRRSRRTTTPPLASVLRGVGTAGSTSSHQRHRYLPPAPSDPPPPLRGSAVGTVEFQSISEPIRRIVGDRANYLEATATAIDPDAKTVQCQHVACEGTSCEFEDFALDYDHLVLAVGATTNTFGVPGVREVGSSVACHIVRSWCPKPLSSNCHLASTASSSSRSPTPTSCAARSATASSAPTSPRSTPPRSATRSASSSSAPGRPASSSAARRGGGGRSATPPPPAPGLVLVLVFVLVLATRTRTAAEWSSSSRLALAQRPSGDPSIRPPTPPSSLVSRLSSLERPAGGW